MSDDRRNKGWWFYTWRLLFTPFLYCLLVLSAFLLWRIKDAGGWDAIWLLVLAGVLFLMFVASIRALVWELREGRGPDFGEQGW